jgi:hypothetical protein
MNSHPPARRGHPVQAIAALLVVFASISPGPLGASENARDAAAVRRAVGAEYTHQVEVPSGGSQARRLAAALPNGVPSAGANAPLAPGLGATIEGIDFDENDANSGDYAIPPDPHGAAGPDHVVSVVNTSIEWHTKAGTQVTSTSLANFFAALTPLTLTFDPKVIYDQYNERFVVVTLERTDTADGDAADTSRIFVAVSDDDDPEGVWYTQAISSMITIDSTPSWADYPGLAVDDEVVYLAYNMFSFGPVVSFTGQRLWIIDKTGLYAGGTSAVTVHDPATESGGFEVTMQPAHMFGTPPGSVGTFLAYYSGITDGADEALGVIRVDDPLGTPTFTNQFVDLGNIEANPLSTLPGAPQPFTTTLIATNDRRALNAVWRDDALWVAMSIMPAAGGDMGEVTAHWVKIDTSTLAALSVADQGNAGGDDIDSGAFTFFPSVMVDQDGNMGIGFALSGPSTYPGAYYTGRRAGDPAGTTESTGVMAAGLESYKRTFGGSRNRWGDYSGMALDPSDEETFWVYNEYALAGFDTFGDGETGRWGTRWGKFGFKPLPDVTIVSDSPDPSLPGQIVAITVTVTGTLGLPTGVVTVTASSGQGSCSSIVLGGTAICDITPTVPGTYSLIAAYSGDGVYASASSAPAGHSVQEPISGLAATNSSPDGLGQTTLFTATVISGTSVAYSWSFGDGDTGSGANPTHVYGSAGLFTAVVTSTNGVSGPITATTAVTITNTAPTANAGPDQEVNVGEVVTLIGTGSTDPEDNPLSYHWSQTGGPAVGLSSATASQPTFTAPAAPTVLTFTLVVTDTGGLADATPDTVVITVDTAGLFLPFVTYNSGAAGLAPSAQGAAAPAARRERLPVV